MDKGFDVKEVAGRLLTELGRAQIDIGIIKGDTEYWNAAKSNLKAAEQYGANTSTDQRRLRDMGYRG